MRPSVDTRDGIPIDDALEMIDHNIQAYSEKSQGHGVLLERIDTEIIQKVDTDQIDLTLKETSYAPVNFQGIFLTVPNLAERDAKAAIRIR